MCGNGFHGGAHAWRGVGWFVGDIWYCISFNSNLKQLARFSLAFFKSFAFSLLRGRILKNKIKTFLQAFYFIWTKKFENSLNLPIHVSVSLISSQSEYFLLFPELTQQDQYSVASSHCTRLKFLSDPVQWHCKSTTNRTMACAFRENEFQHFWIHRGQKNEESVEKKHWNYFRLNKNVLTLRINSPLDKHPTTIQLFECIDVGCNDWCKQHSFRFHTAEISNSNLL